MATVADLRLHHTLRRLSEMISDVALRVRMDAFNGDSLASLALKILFLSSRIHYLGPPQILGFARGSRIGRFKRTPPSTECLGEPFGDQFWGLSDPYSRAPANGIQRATITFASRGLLQEAAGTRLA